MNERNKVLGLILVVIGIGFLGNQFHLWYFQLFFRGWWAIALVAWGSLQVSKDGLNQRNAVIILLGIYLFIVSNGWIKWRDVFPFLFALALILVGVRLLLHPTNQEMDQNGHLELRSIFQKLSFETSNKVYTCKSDAMFALTQIDVSKADVSQLKVIDIHCVAATTRVYVPNNVNIQVQSNNVLGYCRIPQNIDTNQEIFIRISAFVGGIEIIRVV